MPVTKMLPLLGGALLLAAAAQAQSLPPPPYLEYTAKFTCGVEPREVDDVVVGTYASSINIHNPQARLTVKFLKKIVVANREGSGLGAIRILNEDETLPPDRAERVDCVLIQKALHQTPTTYVEGFVVIEVPRVTIGTTSFQPLLDVVAKYTARPTNGQISTQSVVPIDGKSITR
ncbi:MAG TPA: hypothetical protein VGF07_11415 [Stellaceae bacterium]